MKAKDLTKWKVNKRNNPRVNELDFWIEARHPILGRVRVADFVDKETAQDVCDAMNKAAK